MKRYFVIITIIKLKNSCRKDEFRSHKYFLDFQLKYINQNDVKIRVVLVTANLRT